MAEGPPEAAADDPIHSHVATCLHSAGMRSKCGGEWETQAKTGSGYAESLEGRAAGPTLPLSSSGQSVATGWAELSWLLERSWHLGNGLGGQEVEEGALRLRKWEALEVVVSSGMGEFQSLELRWFLEGQSPAQGGAGIHTSGCGPCTHMDT